MHNQIWFSVTFYAATTASIFLCYIPRETRHHILGTNNNSHPFLWFRDSDFCSIEPLVFREVPYQRLISRPSANSPCFTDTAAPKSFDFLISRVTFPLRKRRWSCVLQWHSLLNARAPARARFISAREKKKASTGFYSLHLWRACCHHSVALSFHLIRWPHHPTSLLVRASHTDNTFSLGPPSDVTQNLHMYEQSLSYKTYGWKYSRTHKLLRQPSDLITVLEEYMRRCCFCEREEEMMSRWSAEGGFPARVSPSA